MENGPIELNVGGTFYTASVKTLAKHPDSLLAKWFTDRAGPETATKDGGGRHFIDRNGELFGYVLDYLRTDQLILPEAFKEKARLRREANYYQLPGLEAEISKTEGREGYITVGYQGTFSFGRQGLAAEVNFRKISRILVCGRVALCREVFGEQLNEGRDPDRGTYDQYTARFFLKHSCLESAFDNLHGSGYRMVGCCASSTSGAPTELGIKPASATTEEERWAHYNEFVFCRS